MKSGNLIIFSGPSGVGKTTLYNKILQLEQFKNKIVKSISYTTRPRRKGEMHGRDYFFVSEKMFLFKQRAGHFLESQKVFSYYYGTPKNYVRKQILRGKHVLLCIDVKGAKSVWRQCPKAIKIFIKAPNIAVLKDRLKKRGTETQTNLTFRLKIARKEILEAPLYDHVIINDDLSHAYKTLKKLLLSYL